MGYLLQANGGNWVCTDLAVGSYSEQRRGKNILNNLNTSPYSFLFAFSHKPQESDRYEENDSTVPVVEIVIPDEELFSPRQWAAAAPYNDQHPTEDTSAIFNSFNDEHYNYELSRFDYDNAVESSPVKKTVSLFTAKYLDKALKSSTPSKPRQREPSQDVLRAPSLRPSGRNSQPGNDNAHVGPTAAVESPVPDLYVRYDKISALQRSSSAQKVAAPLSAVPSASAVAPSKNHAATSKEAKRPAVLQHPYFDPNPAGFEDSSLKKPAAEASHEMTNASSANEESKSSTSSQRDLDTSLDRAMDALEEDLANLEYKPSLGGSMVARRLAEMEKAAAEAALSRPVSTVGKVALPGFQKVTSKWGTPGEPREPSALLTKTAQASANHHDRVAPVAKPAPLVAPKVDVFTVCNPSHTDHELSELLRASRGGPPICVLILRHNSISHPEQLDLTNRFGRLLDLDLSFNAIAGAVNGLPPTLQRLDLSHNRITNISSIAGCADLKELNLSHNNIKSFHELPATLETLDLSYNSISAEMTLRVLVLCPLIVSLDLTENPIMLVQKDWRVTMCSILPALGHLNGKPTAGPPRRMVRRESAAIAHSRTDPPPPPPLRAASRPRSQSRSVSRSRAEVHQRANDTLRARQHDQKFEQLIQAREHHSTEVVSRGTVLKPQQVKALTQRLTTPTATALLKAGAPSAPPPLFSEKDLLLRKWAPPKNEKYHKISFPAVPSDATWARKRAPAVEFYSHQELSPHKQRGSSFGEESGSHATRSVSDDREFERLSEPLDFSSADDRAKTRAEDTTESGSHESKVNEIAVVDPLPLPAAATEVSIIALPAASASVEQPPVLQVLPAQEVLVESRPASAYSADSAGSEGSTAPAAVVDPKVVVPVRSVSPYVPLSALLKTSADHTTPATGAAREDSQLSFASAEGPESKMSAKERLQARMDRSKSPGVRTPSALTVTSSLAPSPVPLPFTHTAGAKWESKATAKSANGSTDHTHEATRVPVHVRGEDGEDTGDEGVAAEYFFTLSADDEAHSESQAQSATYGTYTTSSDSQALTISSSEASRQRNSDASASVASSKLGGAPRAGIASPPTPPQQEEFVPAQVPVVAPVPALTPVYVPTLVIAPSVAVTPCMEREPLELLISPPRHARNSFTVNSASSNFGADSPLVASVSEVEPMSSKLSAKDRLMARMAKNKT